MRSAKLFPRTLIVTDCAISQNSFGLTRTLWNLFESYPQSMLGVASPNSRRSDGAVPGLIGTWRRATPARIMPSRAGRLGSVINPFAAFVSRSSLSWQSLSVADYANEKIDLVLVVTNFVEQFILAKRLANASDCPLVIYAMDDWRDLDSARWLGWKGSSFFRALLGEAAGLISVSQALSSTLESRYGLSLRRSHVAHNPVHFEAEEQRVASQNGRVFRLAYAGSLWGMHLDALVVLAQAVKLLRQRGQEIELLVYTAKEDWLRNSDTFEALEVIYGGFVPYSNLRSELAKSSLLLAPSSFLPENRHLVTTSVQTKLTDYMASGRAILSCGPPGAALHSFVRAWNCGAVVEVDDPEKVAKLIEQLRSNPTLLDQMGERGFSNAKVHFEREVVSRDLYAFLSECAGK